MNEQKIGESSFEADGSGQADDSVKTEASDSAEGRKREEQPLGPVKRGRGRPPKNQKSETTESAGEDKEHEASASQVPSANLNPAENAAVSDAEDGKPENSQAQEYVLVSRGMELLTELVRSQNQSQEKLIRSQTEFSSSVMDRMDQYRMQISKLESEAAEKEKNRLRDSYLEAQRKADECMEEIHQLRTQLDLSGRKVLKLNVRIEKLTEENESLRQQLQVIKEKTIEENKPVSGSRTNTSSNEKEDGAAGADGEPGKDLENSGFRGWSKRRRKKFLEKVYCDRRYSDEQIELIQEADRAGVPLSGLKELCDPKISLGNMQVMLSYMRR